LDESAEQIGKNFPVAAGVLGDTKVGLAELDDQLGRMMNEFGRVAAAKRAENWGRLHHETREQLKAKIAARKNDRPLAGGVMMSALAGVLPENVAVIEEAVTTTNTTLHRLGVLKNTSGYFAHRGWALGWGLGCSLGVKLAWPERPVLAI